MKRMMRMGWASVVSSAILASLADAKAMLIAPAPIAQRVATADCVVVGKVIGFAEKPVSAPVQPGAEEKQYFRIAIIKIETNIRGAKGMKEIRVGFIPPMPPVAGGVRPPIRFRGVTFTADQEACFFLSKRPDADFYTAPAYFSVINKRGNEGFDKEVKEAKRCAELLADPSAGLAAKDDKDRLLTAGLLIWHFRMHRPSATEPKQEPINAALSKKVLLVLADADWSVRPRPGRFSRLTPQSLFFELGITEKDGWKQPKDIRQVPAAAKQWLKDNAGTYRIQRFVYEKSAK